MQRTVTSTEITYAKTEIVNGELVATLDTHFVFNEKNEKKAHKKAEKALAMHFTPLATKITKDLYYMDDETFFKYATKIENPTLEQIAEAEAEEENGEE